MGPIETLLQLLKQWRRIRIGTVQIPLMESLTDAELSEVQTTCPGAEIYKADDGQLWLNIPNADTLVDTSPGLDL